MNRTILMLAAALAVAGCVRKDSAIPPDASAPVVVEVDYAVSPMAVISAGIAEKKYNGLKSRFLILDSFPMPPVSQRRQMIIVRWRSANAQVLRSDYRHGTATELLALSDQHPTTVAPYKALCSGNSVASTKGVSGHLAISAGRRIGVFRESCEWGLLVKMRPIA